MKVEFSVLGPPKGKGRPRVTRQGFAFTPKDTVEYENLVRLEYRMQCNDYYFPDNMPLDVRIMVYYPITKSTSKKNRLLMLNKELRPVKKPDLDNIAKIICDSLNGIAFHDDSAVSDLMVRKFYSDNPRTVITIQEAKCVERADGNEQRIRV